MNYPNASAEGYPPQAGVFNRMEYASNPDSEKQHSRRKGPQSTQRHDLDISSKQQLELPSMPHQRLHHHQNSHMISSQPQHSGQFGILAPTPMPIPTGPVGHTSVQYVSSHASEDPMQSAGSANATAEKHGKLISRLVPDPPDLQAWREKLFNVDDTIVLTHDQ